MPIDPVTGSIITGVGSTLLSGLLGSSAQSRANRANIRLQRENQAWMERMSNTEYQRGTKDMLAAGLNPMLAFSQGGASTPSSSAATVQPEDAFARSVSSAGDKAMRAIELQNLQAITKQNQEKAHQEGFVTDEMRMRWGIGGGKNYMADELENKNRRERAQADLARTDVQIRQIERDVAEQIQGYQVNSARALSQVQEREVDIQEIRQILMRLDIPEKKALADWFEAVGSASPTAKAVMSIGQWLKMIFGGGK